MNRLYRCRENRVLAGVASGVAEFFNLDPTLVRILWFISIFFWGAGILVYIGLALIVPLEPAVLIAGTPGAPGTPDAPGGDATTSVDPTTGAVHAAHTHAAGLADGHRHANRGSGRLSLYLGIGLMVIGGLALIDIVLPDWWSWRQMWPLVAIGLGGVLIVGALRRERGSTDL